MSIESEARRELGQLLRAAREREIGLKRGSLAKRARLDKKTIAKMEHGVVNPNRHDFLNVIHAVKLTPQEKTRAGRLLRIVHPPKRVKLHFNFSLLRHRNRARVH